MPAEAPHTSWNEIQYLSWSEFKQMTPSILQLEVTRLGKIIDSVHDDTDFHNGLVRARFAAKKFIVCLENAKKDRVEETCAAHLREAIANVSLRPENLDPQTEDTCRYILNRLNYVYFRIRLIY